MNTQGITLLLLLFYYSLSLSSQNSWPDKGAEQNAAERRWESGFELGTGLSFTGYNANLAYVAKFGDNVIFAGPKIVYSDANDLFDAPWGIHLGYRRRFIIKPRFSALAAIEYQSIFFQFKDFGGEDWNSIHEFHASYGFQFELSEKWYLGQTLGLGAYLERLVDPFDGRVDSFSGFSPQARLWLGYRL